LSFHTFPLFSFGYGAFPEGIALHKPVNVWCSLQVFDHVIFTPDHGRALSRAKAKREFIAMRAGAARVKFFVAR
jgi:hypothetical protein